jgi:hypothetical protein
MIIIIIIIIIKFETLIIIIKTFQGWTHPLKKLLKIIPCRILLSWQLKGQKTAKICISKIKRYVKHDITTMIFTCMSIYIDAFISLCLRDIWIKLILGQKQNVIFSCFILFWDWNIWNICFSKEISALHSTI